MDHCTLWFEGAWGHCCEAHDAAYGGEAARMAADLALRDCVAATGHPVMAVLMFAGVVGAGWLFRWAAKRQIWRSGPKT